jgi:hypothetical protein
VGTTVLVQPLSVNTSFVDVHERDTYLNKLTFRSTGFIIDRSLGSLGEELDGRETPDVVLGCDGLVVGLIGIHVCDNTVGLGSECSSDILVSGLHVLMVSLPP